MKLLNPSSPKPAAQNKSNDTSGKTKETKAKKSESANESPKRLTGQKNNAQTHKEPEQNSKKKDADVQKQQTISSNASTEQVNTLAAEPEVDSSLKVKESEANFFTTKAQQAEQMGWSERDTKTALNELEKAMQQACSADNDPYTQLFADMPVRVDERLEVSNNEYEVAFNGYTATVTVRGKDGFSDVEIVTPFNTAQLQSCMDIVGTSGENNGLQFVQKGTNGVYNDQCLGMAAIYGSMLKGESAYLQQTGSGWEQNSDSRLFWNNGVLTASNGGNCINECTDTENYSKLTFGSQNESRQTSAAEMRSTIIKNLQSGNPVIVEVGAIHGDSDLSRHYVTAIGYTRDENGAPQDIIVWDPFTGDCRRLNYSYEEQGRSPFNWINEYDGDRVPVQGRDVHKTGCSDDPDAFQIYVWRGSQQQTAVST